MDTSGHSIELRYRDIKRLVEIVLERILQNSSLMYMGRTV